MIGDMKRSDIVKFRITKLLAEHKNYDFPTFIQLLRQISGINRKTVQEDIGITQQILFYMEYGRFIRPPSKVYLMLLSKYYGLPPKLLKSKLQEFMKKKTNKRPYEKMQNMQTIKAL
jgi:hypothetical protein